MLCTDRWNQVGCRFENDLSCCLFAYCTVDVTSFSTLLVFAVDGAPIQYTGQVPALQKNILCRQCSTQKTLLCLHYSRNDLHFHRRRFNGWHSGLRQALPRYLCVLGLGVSPGPHLSGTSLLLGND